MLRLCQCQNVSQQPWPRQVPPGRVIARMVAWNVAAPLAVPPMLRVLLGRARKDRTMAYERPMVYEIGYAIKGARTVSIAHCLNASEAIKRVRALDGTPSELRFIRSPVGLALNVGELEALAEQGEAH